MFFWSNFMQRFAVKLPHWIIYLLTWQKKKYHTVVNFKMFYSSTSILCCKMAVS